MNVKLAPGKYVSAVSGGVDSVVLLDILSKQKDVELIVAHFDHGIRDGSKDDAAFVEQLAGQYGKPFERGTARLGPHTSEEKARNARYDFLQQATSKYRADGLVTAHHQDDLIETAFLNILRGTGPRGLAAINSNPKVMRPLINFSRAEIEKYAVDHNLIWREDPTNDDQKYLRNYIRHNLMPRLSASKRAQIIKHIDQIAANQKTSDDLTATISRTMEENGKIKRAELSQLDARLAASLLHAKYRGLGDVNRQTIDRLNVAIRTAKPGSRTNIIKDYDLVLDGDYAWLEERAN